MLKKEKGKNKMAVKKAKADEQISGTRFPEQEQEQEQEQENEVIQLEGTPPVRAFKSIAKALEDNNKTLLEKQRPIKNSFFDEINSEETGTMLKSLPIILNAVKIIEYDEIIIKNLAEITVQINVMLNELAKLLAVNESDEEQK